MNSIDIYNALRTVPPEAKKRIGGGRLKGMTDINPMWRIKRLTEVFGECGGGWKYEIVRQWTEPGADGEVAAFCDINLYVTFESAWSDPIPGVGGSMLITKEAGGLHTNDEAFKMALTDALSVAAKALGLGADVYFEKDESKYTAPDEPRPDKLKSDELRCDECDAPLEGVVSKSGKQLTPAQWAETTKAHYDGKVLCVSCAKKYSTE